jgi:hypothetical protein
MPRYQLHYRVATALSSPNDVSLKSSGYEVSFLFSTKKGRASSVLTRVTVEAPDHEAASSLCSGSVIPPCLDALALTSGRGLLLGECELVLKDETGSAVRKGKYVGQNAPPEQIKLEETAIKAAQSICDWNGGSILPLCWLRYSNQRQLTLEKFLFAWLAFEELAGDTDIVTNCRHCMKEVSHRGADKNRAWELFRAADPTFERKIFDNEIWGRARNALFHGAKYPDPRFLAQLAKLVEPLQKAVCLETQEIYKLGETPQPTPGSIFRVFLYFDWDTKQHNEPFPTDWPQAELEGLAQSAALDGKWRIRSSDTMRLLDSKEFAGCSIKPCRCL